MLLSDCANFRQKRGKAKKRRKQQIQGGVAFDGLCSCGVHGLLEILPAAHVAKICLQQETACIRQPLFEVHVETRRVHLHKGFATFHFGY